MSLKYLTNINLNQNQLENFAIQNLATAPSSPVAGQMYFNTTSKLLYLCNNPSADTEEGKWTVVGEYTFGDGFESVDSVTRLVKVKGGNGIAVSSDGVAVDIQDKAGLGFDASTGKLGVLVDGDKGIAVDSTSGKIGAVVNTASGLMVSDAGIALKVKDNSGIKASTDGVEVVLDSTANLSFTTDGKITLATDASPVENSTKALQSGGAFTALGKKVDKLSTEHSADQTVTSVVTYNKAGLVTGGTTISLGGKSVDGGVTGVATLDANGLVPSAQLPSYVDDVIEGYYYNGKFYEEAAHTTEITGETGKIYVDIDETKTGALKNATYRWSGTAFIIISNAIDYATDSDIETATDEVKVVTSKTARHAVEYWAESVADTLKSKTIDADSNTISNIEVDNFKSGVVQTTLREESLASDTALVSEKAIRAALDTVVGGSVHKETFVNGTDGDFSVSSGRGVWTITSSLGSDVDVTVKDASGNVVMTDVTLANGTITIGINTSTKPNAGDFKVVVIG